MNEISKWKTLKRNTTLKIIVRTNLLRKAFEKRRQLKKKSH